MVNSEIPVNTQRWYRRITRRDIIAAVIILIPLWMFLAWLLTPMKPLRIFILDNTVPNQTYNEHRSLIWQLRHDRYSIHNRLYDMERDYYGFVPKIPGRLYNIRDLADFHQDDLDTLSQNFDMAYITDTYGVYEHNWLGAEFKGEISKLIYGGLSKESVQFIQTLAAQKKLVIAEFNFIATPTARPARKEIERLYGFSWTGWTGRYYDNLEKTNPDLPEWVVRLYETQYDTTWQFFNPGIVLVHRDERIAVLELHNHLNVAMPEVFTTRYGKSRWSNLPDHEIFPFWFDVITTGKDCKVVANYRITTSARGDSLLNSLNIPNVFPAVIIRDDPPFLYMAGDVSDTWVKDYLAYFKGVEYFRSWFYRRNDESDRDRYFWEYTYPLLHSVLKDYRKSISE